MHTEMMNFKRLRKKHNFLTKRWCKFRWFGIISIVHIDVTFFFTHHVCKHCLFVLYMNNKILNNDDILINDDFTDVNHRHGEKN